MSDKESHSKSEFHYPKEEERAKKKLSKTTLAKLQLTEKISVTAGNSQEELQKFVQEQKSENTEKNVK